MVGSSYTAKLDNDVHNPESYTTYELAVRVLMHGLNVGIFYLT